VCNKTALANGHMRNSPKLFETSPSREIYPQSSASLLDGMDEYNEDYLDLCATLKEFPASPHIKLGLSSRP
jgi:hypothetical protein